MAFQKAGKRIQVAVFVPSVERDNVTRIDQDRWTNAALEAFGNIFGRATAYTKAKGVWRDDEQEEKLLFDEPVLVQAYVPPDAVDQAARNKLAAFCERLCREANQAEVGVMIDSDYYAVRES